MLSVSAKCGLITRNKLFGVKRLFVTLLASNIYHNYEPDGVDCHQASLFWRLWYMKQKEIKVLMVEPGKRPRVTTLVDDLDSLQKAVSVGAEYQGLIEIISLGNGDCLLCNEEGKLIGLEGNRRLGDDIIVGVFYIMSENEDGELVSLGCSFIAVLLVSDVAGTHKPSILLCSCVMIPARAFGQGSDGSCRNFFLDDLRSTLFL